MEENKAHAIKNILKSDHSVYGCGSICKSNRVELTGILKLNNKYLFVHVFLLKKKKKKKTDQQQKPNLLFLFWTKEILRVL